MKAVLWMFLLILPFFADAQSKKKKLKQQQEQEKLFNKNLLYNLQKHVYILASDSLEGRRAGTKGEILAADYLVKTYEGTNILPAGKQGYLQYFTINEGRKLTANSYFRVNDRELSYPQHYFPLSFSGKQMVSGQVARAMKENGQPWFVDVKDWLDENKNNPHFAIENYIQKEVAKVIKKGAKALFLYNSGKTPDNIQFQKNDTTTAVSIPVVYITAKGIQEYFKDYAATQQVTVFTEIVEQQRTSCNVVGFIDNKATNTVILGAHFDHLGYGEDKNALDTAHQVHNGADDNASGTAALIELAKWLSHSSLKNNNYLIIHFGAEELGLLGSKYWLNNPTTNITANYMINMDMVGRYDTTHKLTIGGYGTSPAWSTVLQTTKTSLIYKTDSTGSGPSDHASFYRAGIPVLFFFTGSHADYHKATDDSEKINYEGQSEIVKLIYQIIERADTLGKLSYLKTNEPTMGRSTRFSVSLGVIPDYGYSGKGVKIDGVSPGKLAEKIGLQAGDVLLQLGDYKFADVGNYMEALSKFKKGDKTVLTISRKGENKSFEIVF